MRGGNQMTPEREDKGVRLSEVPSMEQRISALERENKRLRAFANDIVECHTGTLEGCDIEDIAVKYGLLELVPVTEACGEGCDCQLVGFPTECYRKMALLAEQPASAQQTYCASCGKMADKCEGC